MPPSRHTYRPTNPHGYSVQWNITFKGEQVEQKIDNAIVKGMETLGNAAAAYGFLYSPVDTGRLRSSIRRTAVMREGNKFRMRWGSFTVPYAYIQEVGGISNWGIQIAGRYYLLQAANKTYGLLIGLIKKWI